MDKVLSLSEVRKRTGLTARALRFYETRHLVQPLRSANGRRYYGAAELVRLHRIVLLKRAGFTLSQIAALLGGAPVAPAQLLEAQIEALLAQREAIDQAVAALRLAKTAGEEVAIESLCEWIRLGSDDMEGKALGDALGRLVAPECRAGMAERAARLVPDGFDHAALMARWRELADRLEDALPLDPSGPAARAYLDEFDDLVAPFLPLSQNLTKADKAALWAGLERMAEMLPTPFSPQAWALIKDAMIARGDARVFLAAESD